MAESSLPATQPDPEGFLKDELTKSGMGIVQANGLKFGINIPINEYMTGLGQFLGGPSSGSAAATAQGSNSAKKQHALKDDIFAEYDMIFIRSSDSVYIRKADKSDPSNLCYRAIQDRDLSNMVRTAFERRGWVLTSREWEETIRTIKKEIRNEAQYVDNGSIQVTNNLFWDATAGKLRNVGEEMNELPEYDGSASWWQQFPTCFRRMFDTTHRSRHTILWDKEQKAEWEGLEKEILDVYEMALDHFNHSNGRLRIPHGDNTIIDPLAKIYFQFVMDWADNNIDTYEDIMRAFASVFLADDKKPVGSYFLIGNSRNGKTTANDLLRTILGANNCSEIRMTDFGNWHAAKDLLSVYANIPDEDSLLDNVKDPSLIFANFKTAADHGEIVMDRMASQERFRINCDFMSFFPMNHYPQWERAESGAEACIKRCWPIFFSHDFSAEDAKTTNFAQDTFVPKILAPFVGTILALAAYHSSHPLEKSPTMQAHNSLIENETSSSSVYRDLFLEHFSGFESQEILWRDYMLFCEDNGYRYSKRANFMRFVNTMVMVEKDANGKPKRPSMRMADGTRMSYYKLKNWSEKNTNILHRGTIVPGETMPGGAPVTLYEYQGGDWKEKNTPEPDGHSILTAIENYETQQQYPVTTPPDQLPPEKPKSSAQWLKEHNEKGELNV